MYILRPQVRRIYPLGQGNNEYIPRSRKLIPENMNIYIKVRGIYPNVKGIYPQVKRKYPLSQGNKSTRSRGYIPRSGEYIH